MARFMFTSKFESIFTQVPVTDKARVVHPAYFKFIMKDFFNKDLFDMPTTELKFLIVRFQSLINYYKLYDPNCFIFYVSSCLYNKGIFDF